MALTREQITRRVAKELGRICESGGSSSPVGPSRSVWSPVAAVTGD